MQMARRPLEGILKIFLEESCCQDPRKSGIRSEKLIELDSMGLALSIKRGKTHTVDKFRPHSHSV